MTNKTIHFTKNSYTFEKGEIMATDFLNLDFRKPDPKFPDRPYARIYVKSSFKDENFDWPIISARCVTFAEIDYQIKRLENELKDIRQKAERKFKSCSSF